MRPCSICKTEKQNEEFTTGRRLDGRASGCMSCMREYSRRWYVENREKELARNAAYRAKKRDAINEISRNRMREKRRADPEGALAYVRAYRAQNPEKVAQWDSKKKAARRNAINGDCVTAAEWREIKQKYRHSCAYCLRPQKRLTMDHIQPLSRGGRHIAENIAPACMSCNASKQARDAIEWVSEKHGRLL